MNTDWEFDKFHEDSYELAKNVEIKKYDNFLKTYNKQLFELEESLTNLPFTSWDMDLDVLDLDVMPFEQASLIELIKTDNKVLNKLVTVFSALCCELSYLIQEGEEKYCVALLYYGEGSHVSSESGDSQMQMAKFLGLLQELSCFVKRCYQVIKSTIQQLSVLYSSQKAAFKIETSEMHFKIVFSYIGSLLRVLLTLDAIIAQQTRLKDDWNTYKRTIKSVHHNSSKFTIDLSKFHRFERHLVELEGKLLDGNIYQNCVEQLFDERTLSVSKNQSFSDEYLYSIRVLFEEIDANLTDNSDQEIRLKFVAVNALLVLYFQIFRTIDKKLLKTIWDSYKKAPAIYLCGTIVWYSGDFLLLKLPIVSQFDKKADQTNKNIRTNYLQAKISNLSKETQQFYLLVTSWMSKMERLNDSSEEKAIQNADLFLKGFQYATSIGNTFTLITSMSTDLGKTMTKSSVLSLCNLVELLKAIKVTYHKKKELFIFSIQNIIQALSNKLLSFVMAAKKRLISDKRYSEKRLDILSGIVLAGNTLSGPITKERLLIAKFGLSIANRMKTFKDDENVNEILNKIEQYVYLNAKINSACDCNFFYWHQEVFFPLYLNDLYENVNSPNKIHYFIWALRDCLGPLRQARHENPDVLSEKLLDNLIDSIKKNFLDRLCRDVETDLRLSIHLHLKLDARKPFKDGIKDLSQFIHILPIRLFNRYIDVKSYVEQYLEKTFYNLTTVTLYDWRTYSEMRNLAEQKYRLTLGDPHLPSQTLEQGLDVLEIMRNIHIFVQKYLYNLNNQIFVEKSSNNKHLNTINIRHIANSIRTHGIGIMNTTVNYTYQYLRKQFFIFSQFLYDEHIKAKLIKDIGFFKENKTHLDQKYPYERAEKFNRGIRKLGVLADNQTYLDQFRLLISQIGNAIGYIRMIRSGGLNCCSNSIRFVPDLDDIISFEQYTEEAKLSEATLQASKNLDSTLNNLIKNFSESTDYFKILVDVFASEFRSQKNMHLRNFYIILPALTLNFVEHMIGCKEKINKKNNQGAAFTDDGFVMGIAYILKLLNQYNDFDTLHWFQSVREKFQSSKKIIVDQQKSIQNDDKLLQTQILTLQRYSTYQREFDFLQFSLSSARVFFSAESETNQDTIIRAATSMATIGSN